jgi:hypothetical protein
MLEHDNLKVWVESNGSPLAVYRVNKEENRTTCFITCEVGKVIPSGLPAISVAAVRFGLVQSRFRRFRSGLLVQIFLDLDWCSGSVQERFGSRFRLVSDRNNAIKSKKIADITVYHLQSYMKACINNISL